MPAIKVIDGVRIYIYFFDHNPPHFHAVFAEFEELIAIESLETLKGTLPQIKRKKVLSWAKENQIYLNTKWNEYNSK